MRLKWLLIILSICLIGCGGGGGDSSDTGSDGGDPIVDELQLPAIVGYGDVDYYLLRVNGNLEEVESPLVYYNRR